MKNNLIVLLLLLVLSSLTASAQNVDVCVYGGTSAGVIAAYTAKKAGKSVILIEPGRHLGGLSSGGLGFTDIGNKYAVTGLGRDFYRRIGSHYGKFEQWIFEPHVAEEIFLQYIKTAGVDVLYDYRIVSTAMDKGYIREIALENSSAPNTAQRKTIKAKMFVDCTYEGDLMAEAGVSYTVGREDNSLYKETYNGVQLHNKHQFPDGISPYKIPGKPESGLLWGISPAALDPTGTGDKKVQAYNFRICLSKDPANSIAITKPAGYDPSRYELLLRLLEKEPDRPFNLILKPDLMPNQKTDINNNGPFSTDMIGMNYNYPEADYATRAKIIREHEEYVKGLLYFIGHDPRMPKHLREEMLMWGYPKDEYTDNDHWSPQAYIREARRMTGAYIMTQDNCEGKIAVEDGVGMAAYTMDSHNTQRIVVNGMVKNEGDVQVGGFPPYPISYRSLIPKAEECKNLFVPVCLSATHIAYGSIRMEPVFMVLAQSSAVAAVMAIDKNVSVQQVDVKQLQQKLKADPLADGSVPEILIDNEDKESVSVKGAWVTLRSERGCYGPSLLADTTANASGSVRFTPTVAKGGVYDIYAYFPRIAKGASPVSFVIHDGKSNQTKSVKPNDVKVEGQTSGEWISLGTYTLPAGKKSYVEIQSEKSSSVFIADAVLIVPYVK